MSSKIYIKQKEARSLLIAETPLIGLGLDTVCVKVSYGSDG